MRIARIALAIVLLAMALGQSVSFDVFEAAIASYRVSPDSLVAPLAALIIAAEAVVGAGLFTRRYRRFAAVGAVIITAFWAALAAQAFARGLVIGNCGCFGRYFSQSLGWWVLLQDAYLVTLAVWVLAGVTRSTQRSIRPSTTP